MVLIVCITLISSPFIQANSSTVESNEKFSAEDLSAFAKKIEKTLAGKGARVFIIGRMGRPANEMPEGIKFTHTALAVYSMLETDDGAVVPGYTIYNLYQRNEEPHISDLIKDYPVDFFSSAQELRAGIVIPSAGLQERLIKTINSDIYKQLHEPKYSAIASPYTLEYQNCTEHTLDVINAAIYQTDDIDQIKVNTTAYFKAQPVNVSGFKLALGSIFMSDVSISDHTGTVETATFTTIGNYLEKYGLTQERFEITWKQ